MSPSAKARSLLLIAAVVIGLPACSADPTQPEPVLTAGVVRSTNRQVGRVGEQLAHPLRLTVRLGGVPQKGVSVAWHAAAGLIMPIDLMTDASGEAAAAWILGPTPGIDTVTVTVDGALGSPVTFTARVMGPPPNWPDE